MALGDSLLKHGFNTQAVQEFRRSLRLADPVDTSADLVHLRLGPVVRRGRGTAGGWSNQL